MLPWQLETTLRFDLWLKRFIYCTLRHHTSPFFFYSPNFLNSNQTSGWSYCSKEPFKSSSESTLTICAPHFQKRLKKYQEYQGDFPQAPKAASTWKDWMKKHRPNLDIIQKIVWLKAAADKANKPSFFTASVSRNSAFENSTDTMGLNIIGQRTDYIYSWVIIHQKRKWSNEILRCAIL